MQVVNQKYFPSSTTNTVDGNKLKAASELTWENDLDEGKKSASEQGKIVMIDTYADWCVACKELEEYTFSAPEVITELKKMVLPRMLWVL